MLVLERFRIDQLSRVYLIEPWVCSCRCDIAKDVWNTNHVHDLNLVSFHVREMFVYNLAFLTHGLDNHAIQIKSRNYCSFIECESFRVLMDRLLIMEHNNHYLFQPWLKRTLNKTNDLTTDEHYLLNYKLVSQYLSLTSMVWGHFQSGTLKQYPILVSC